MNSILVDQSSSVNKTVLVNQTLDPMSLHINDVVLRQYKGTIQKLIPITSSDNKGYYVMTESLAHKSVFCNTNKIIDKNGKTHYINKFRLTIPKYDTLFFAENE